MQELPFDSFLETENPESLKYGTVAGEMRLCIARASNQPEDQMLLRPFRLMDLTVIQRKIFFAFAIEVI
jgi:hypothetical protein